MDKLHPPGPLNLQGNLSENWRKWKQRFELFSSASGLSEKDERYSRRPCSTWQEKKPWKSITHSRGTAKETRKK